MELTLELLHSLGETWVRVLSMSHKVLDNALNNIPLTSYYVRDIVNSPMKV